MSDTAKETIVPPFTAFNFLVEIDVPGYAQGLCSAAFAECDGLEMSVENKTIREGGANGRQVHLSGPVAYGQLTLRRGMTSNFDLWRWFEISQTTAGMSMRADIEVVFLASDGSRSDVRFVLDDCLPIRLRAPALNAREGQIAIEEMTVAYERMSMSSGEA